MSIPVRPEVEVEITLFPFSDAGRRSAIAQGEYRGVLSVQGGNFSVRFEVTDEPFGPGQTRQLGIQFLFPDAALPHFPVGATFSVWEGKIIGQGIVLAVTATS